MLVGLEPSCLAVLRHDAVALLGADDPAAVAVAQAARTLAEVLGATHGWVPPDLSGVVAVAQPHCHQHAVLGWEADRDLLAKAGAEVTAVGGCCGLAGNFGAERGTTSSRSLSPRPPYSRPPEPPARTRSSWPTASPAGPSSTTWPAAGPSTWPSYSPAAGVERAARLGVGGWAGSAVAGSSERCWARSCWSRK